MLSVIRSRAGRYGCVHYCGGAHMVAVAGLGRRRFQRENTVGVLSDMRSGRFCYR